ncbi:MerR family transcriptional regulator [Candidatus Nitrospira nitrosa]|uniref:MerR family transcriptional regulator n=1 Tax=Candidatus Nitrospira nitrosa TaxID=1742972 RepID=UPI000B89E1FC
MLRDLVPVWEWRFEILKSTRTTNRYSNYSAEDVALLRFFKQQLNTGASIGERSKLAREELLIPTPGIGGAALA